MKQTIFIFGGLAMAILLLFELSKLSLLASTALNDTFLVVSGALFIGVGVLIHRLFSGADKPALSVNPVLVKKSGLSPQEYRVFLLMADGLTNIEIAEYLFIAPSTVKTHVSRILGKLNARRRTEAVKIGRDLEII